MNWAPRSPGGTSQAQHWAEGMSCSALAPLLCCTLWVGLRRGYCCDCLCGFGMSVLGCSPFSPLSQSLAVNRILRVYLRCRGQVGGAAVVGGISREYWPHSLNSPTPALPIIKDTTLGVFKVTPCVLGAAAREWSKAAAATAPCAPQRSGQDILLFPF